MPKTKGCFGGQALNLATSLKQALLLLQTLLEITQTIKAKHFILATCKTLLSLENLLRRKYERSLKED